MYQSIILKKMKCRKNTFIIKVIYDLCKCVKIRHSYMVDYNVDF